MLEPERQKPADYLTSAQAAIRESKARRLFGFCVPSTADQDERRDNAGSKNTEEDSRC